MSTSIYRAKKISDRIDELALISDRKEYLVRTFGSPAFQQASRLIQKWMREAGLQVNVDNIGNVRGRLPGNAAAKKVFVMGSHVDTVISAGKFDGPLGVLMAIDQIDKLKSCDYRPFHLEVVAFSDEEGVRYHTAYLGSRVLAGRLPEQYLNRVDKDGVTMIEAITEIGGDPGKLKSDAIPKEDFMGYLEVHIEQGPILQERGVPIGVVSSISGQLRVELAFTGRSGHAGTTPMYLRKDAITGAAAFVLAVEEEARAEENNVIATTGKLSAFPGASNVIAEKAILSLDLRSADDEALHKSCERLNKIALEICEQRGLELSWEIIQENKSVECDPQYINFLKESVESAGLPVMELASGAGHDAVAIAEVAPVCMLFVRCQDGISHHPDEYVRLEDISSAIEACDHFFENLLASKSKIYENNR